MTQFISSYSVFCYPLVVKKLVVCGIFFIAYTLFAQESKSTQHIFPYDICNDPCWMGIVLGQSTSSDVDEMLEQFSSLINISEYGRTISRLPNGEFAVNEETDVIQQGGYTFDVLTQTSQFPDFGVASRIEIQDSVVSLIMIIASEEYDIALSDVLSIMGTPDQIRMYSTISRGDEFTLIYDDMLTDINMYQSGDACNTGDLIDNFSLLNLFFYSEDVALEPTYSVDQTILHPNLYAYRYETERDVPLELWESWLSGEVDESCYEAWSNLAPPDLEAIAITPTPTIEATAEPRP